jgi:hypothetical protein
MMMKDRARARAALAMPARIAGGPGRVALVLVVLAAASPAFAQATKYVSEGDTWKYFKGTEEPPADWNQLSFDDSTWLEGPSPFGYGDITTGTILTDMAGAYLSIYIRIKFTVGSLSEAPALNLRMRYDDGFAAYLNGTEIVRKSLGAAGTPIAFDTPATDHETNPTFEDNVICSAPALQVGENVLAITGHNVNLTSSDLALIPELVPIATLCPINLTCRATTTPSIVLRWTKPTATFAYDEIIITRNGVRIDPGPAGTASAYTDRAPVAGVNDYTVTATGCGVPCTGANVLTCSVTVGGAAESFRRGDADANGVVNITDSIFILNALFQGGTQPACPDAADTDDNAIVNITDAVFLLDALFRGGTQPPAPGTLNCGPDGTTDDTLTACSYTTC